MTNRGSLIVTSEGFEWSTFMEAHRQKKEEEKNVLTQHDEERYDAAELSLMGGFVAIPPSVFKKSTTAHPSLRSCSSNGWSSDNSLSDSDTPQHRTGRVNMHNSSIAHIVRDNQEFRQLQEEMRNSGLRSGFASRQVVTGYIGKKEFVARRKSSMASTTSDTTGRSSLYDEPHHHIQEEKGEDDEDDDDTKTTKSQEMLRSLPFFALVVPTKKSKKPTESRKWSL